MYTPHTVTVYNVTEDNATFKSVINATVLRGVFLDISKGANVMKSGLASADAATLFVPFSIQAINAMNGEPQTYCKPKEYERLDDKSGFWTIRPGGSASSADCFFVKGEIHDESDFQTINNTYDDVYRVSSVDIRDFGSLDMQHWQIGGR